MAALFGLLLASSCSRIAPEDAVRDLKSQRESQSLWEEDPQTGLATATFHIPGARFDSYLCQPGSGSDPFAEPASKEQMTPTQWVESRFGAPIPEGGTVRYDRERELLTITHEKTVLPLIQFILQSDAGNVDVVNCRLEIFQVPALLVLRLEESAAEGFDHRPEWEKLRELMRKNRGREDFRMVSALTIVSRSGGRARIASGEEVEFFEKYELEETKEPLTPVAKFARRTVGTSLEVEPYVGGDHRTIDIGLEMEHHTADPVETLESVRVRGLRDSIPTPVKRFSAVSLNTQLTVSAGQATLLGSWWPRGDVEAERLNLRQIAFLIVDLQSEVTR
ncbi:MAG: hypothetical protein KDN19_11340 [Verrucomicrobiae bacterium]|nr:hypothetical protein [Verrucomicrobiae bacterium]